MPKSKRNKQISLTRTQKKPLELKKHLIDEIRSCVDKYANIYVISVNDMRNSKLKDVREHWKHSRFFFGKNKVMALALGRNSEEEYRVNLHKVSSRLKGQCGLLFSNQSNEEVLQWFQSFVGADFARSGNTAVYDVNLKQGPTLQFHHSLEPYLRQLGLPTTLQKGVVHLVKDFQVCREGEILTPEKAKILKLLGHQMAEFRIVIECMWSCDGMFKCINRSSADKENTILQINFQKKCIPEINSMHIEKDIMEVDMNDDNVTKENNDKRKCNIGSKLDTCSLEESDDYIKVVDSSIAAENQPDLIKNAGVEHDECINDEYVNESLIKHSITVATNKSNESTNQGGKDKEEKLVVSSDEDEIVETEKEEKLVVSSDEDEIVETEKEEKLVVSSDEDEIVETEKPPEENYTNISPGVELPTKKKILNNEGAESESNCNVKKSTKQGGEDIEENSVLCLDEDVVEIEKASEESYTNISPVVELPAKKKILPNQDAESEPNLSENKSMKQENSVIKSVDELEIEKSPHGKTDVTPKDKVFAKKRAFANNDDEVECSSVQTLNEWSKKMKTVASSPDEQSPVFRALRNRTVKISKKKKKK